MPVALLGTVGTPESSLLAAGYVSRVDMRAVAAADDKIGFEGWTLTKSTGELAKGEVVTRLQQQPLQVLIELVEHSGELVTREHLIARLWPKGIVDFDTSLNTAVRKLRVALNDDPEKPRYIETIPRRGYRFLHYLTIHPESDLNPTRAVKR